MRRSPGTGLLLSLLALAVLAVIVALTPLAYATPPDPVWMSGIFDDDDNDDGVFLVTSSTATLDPFPLCCWAPFPVHSPGLIFEERTPASPECFSIADARASPLA